MEFGSVHAARRRGPADACVTGVEDGRPRRSSHRSRCQTGKINREPAFYFGCDKTRVHTVFGTRFSIGTGTGSRPGPELRPGCIALFGGDHRPAFPHVPAFSIVLSEGTLAEVGPSHRLSRSQHSGHQIPCSNVTLVSGNRSVCDRGIVIRGNELDDVSDSTRAMTRRCSGRVSPRCRWGIDGDGSAASTRTCSAMFSGAAH